jgi:type VI secretion system VasI family protein
MISRGLILAGTFLYAILSTARACASDQGDKSPSQASIDACRNMSDRMGRLECFDRLFSTPINLRAMSAPPIEEGTPVSQLRIFVLDQESARHADQTNWLMRLRPWNTNMYFPIDSSSDLDKKQPDIAAQAPNWTLETSDIFLTVREADVHRAPERLDDLGILMVSCENDITTLYFTLPRPVADARTQIALNSDSGESVNLTWRDFESGDVILAGRGLESIDLLHTLTRFKRIQLQVKYDDGPRAFIFEIGDLQDKLKPIRQACHWT